MVWPTNGLTPPSVKSGVYRNVPACLAVPSNTSSSVAPDLNGPQAYSSLRAVTKHCEGTWRTLCSPNQLSVLACTSATVETWRFWIGRPMFVILRSSDDILPPAGAVATVVSPTLRRQGSG